MTERVYPGYRWFVLFVLLFATVAQGVVLIWPAPLLEQIAKHYSVDLGAATGALMVAFTIFVTVGAIVGGICCDKFGWVPTLIVSVTLLAVSTILVPLFGNGFGTLVLARIIEGAGAGPIMASVGAVSVQWFPHKERAIVTGIQGMGVSLGIALGFAFVPMAFVKTGSFLAAASWMSIFPIVGVLFLVVVALGKKPPVFSDAEISGEGDPVNTDQDFKIAAKLPVFYVGILCIFFLSWVMQAFNDLTPVYLAAQAPLGAGHGVEVAGKFMALVQVSFMVGSVASGFLLEKVFRESNKTVIAIGFLGAAIFALSVRFPFVNGNLKILPICLFLAGFFQGWIVPTSLAFIAMHFPSHIVGKMTGIWMGVGIFGGTAGVIAGASLLHKTGLYQASIVAVGIVGLVGFLCSLFLNPPAVFKGAEKKERTLALGGH
ncbi:MFS transporter [Holophaga foetida]|uniref:MFS transporter n=1 Tax=Holophaga foetida TaxID=35839 RepID=UPI0002473B3C|nr:MFS transporter [Holophaga foetida]